MIQRIQSLYLLVSAVLLAIATFHNFALFTFGEYEIIFSPYAITASTPGVIEPQTMLSLCVCMWIMVAATIGTIFAYRNRRLQMNIIRYLSIFKIALIAFVAAFVYRMFAGATSELINIQPKASALLLVVSIIIDILAFSAIRKDDKLVRSIDTIR